MSLPLRSTHRARLALLLLLAVAACGGAGTDGAGDGAAADGGDRAGEPAGRPPGTAAPWLEGQVSAAAEVPTATLTSVRTGRNEGFDRLVLEFREGVPGYTVRFVDRPLHQCGSGEPIEVDAPHALQVQLETAAAHDEQGRVTIAERERSPGLPVVRSARLTCDFEGGVEWVLGLERRTAFRAFALADPSRLVVDLRHE